MCEYDLDERGLAAGLLSILDAVDANRPAFEREAAKRGITLNQMTAAAMAEQIVQQLEKLLSSETNHK